MITYQLTVPTENTPGKLARVSGILSREKINIRAITISSFGDKGFFNILVDDPKLALKALTREGVEARLQQVIAAVIDDRPAWTRLYRSWQTRHQYRVRVRLRLESRPRRVVAIQRPGQGADAQSTVQDLSPETLQRSSPFHYNEVLILRAGPFQKPAIKGAQAW